VAGQRFGPGCRAGGAGSTGPRVSNKSLGLFLTARGSLETWDCGPDAGGHGPACRAWSRRAAGDAGCSLVLRPPVISLALGAITRAGYCRFEHADQIRFSLCRPSGSANRPVYAAIGVTLEGRKDVLGLWAGTGGEGCGTATGSAGRAAAAA
jgi:hypothetical protein